MFDKLINFFTELKINEKVDYRVLFSKSFTNKHKDEIIYFYNLNVPYLWSRVFGFMLILGFISFLNTIYVGVYAYAWLTLMITSIIPISVLVFFYELSKTKEINITKSLIVFAFTTTISIFLVGQFNLSSNDFIDTVIIAPLIEEVAKLMTVLIVIKYLKIQKMSTAIIIGWLIGSGFQIAESMGYATVHGVNGLLMNGSLDYSVLFTRSLYGFNSHALWAAIHAVGIILTLHHKNNVFIKTSLLTVVLHAVWNFIAVINIGDLVKFPIYILLQLLFIPIVIMFIKLIIDDEKIKDDKSDIYMN